MRDAEAGAEQHQSADRAPEQRAPAEARLGRDDRRLERDRQLRRFVFRGDVNRAAGRAALIVRIGHDHARRRRA